ncbi:MAG: YraN family protein [Eubacterium sp.]|jgi:putative endonuclease|nr:YraN family protein [Eubacterium sp.]MCH4046143.1 YraN family protein [Eubacterium sp.]MCH4079238.1 YraN family protein [Eubacterium sp.]MCH4110462.1 YraN family protein [Eubacterium sp.]MCI1307973.1 YraN family protein [Eubacterium sp.]
MMRDRKLLGSLGERFAEAVLFSEGWRIRERNYSCGMGEIDLIIERDPELCFVEVKTRMNSRMCRPAEAVDRRKQRRIRAAAQWYMTEKRITGRYIRFMVFEVSGSEISASFS